MSSESSPHSVPEETDCLVCGSGKSSTLNPILFCDGPGCDIPVHKRCYRVDEVPSGDWYCQRCEDRISVSDTPSCCCPQRRGAFKRTTIPNQYIHVACARFHSSLNENVDPIAFNTSLSNKQICCLCSSDYGICSKCSIESCSRVMHVTCAQNDALMTKGKGCQLFCDLHRDIGVLNRIMNRPSRQDRSSSSTPAPSTGRSTKRNQNYRESASESEDDDDDHSGQDEELLDPATSDSEDNYRRRRSSAATSLNSRRHSKNKRSLDSDEQFVKDESSDSEEIDVDDSEAVLGSSAGDRSASTNQRKRVKSTTIGPKESAAESQRRRLLKTLDMNKKRRSSGGLNNAMNLSNIPIRTLGGVGLAASTIGSGSGGEGKQKLPGISRHGLNNNPSGFDPLSKAKPGGSNVSPSLGSSERFSNVGGNPNSGRGSIDGSVKNKKGLTFELDPAMDVGGLKGVTVFAGSVTASPVIPNFSNSASVQTRLGERQQVSPKMGYGPFTDETREQPTIQSLLGKVTSLENTIQALTHQKQQLQQQLATANATAPSSGSSSSTHTPSSSISASSTATSSVLLQANPHTIGPPGQDLQYRFDALEHAFAEEKMNSASLRENLREIFGVLQLTVKPVGTDKPQGNANNDEVAWNAENLDAYVQALRDAMVGPETSPSLDSKQMGQIVDRVIGELVKPPVSAT